MFTNFDEHILHRDVRLVARMVGSRPTDQAFKSLTSHSTSFSATLKEKTSFFLVPFSSIVFFNSCQNSSFFIRKIIKNRTINQMSLFDKYGSSIPNSRVNNGIKDIGNKISGHRNRNRHAGDGNEDIIIEKLEGQIK